jgi:endonuclease/exonuclease/phosphatase family metal-dependent hydrolase
MGDFNFTSDSEQYAITTALLEDSERTARDAGGQPGGGEVIDHIFVSPGTEVLQYRHVGGKNSDHPAAEAVIRL